MTSPSRASGESGSVLWLFPVAFLIVAILGAIAVDLTHLHMAQSDLDDLAASIANNETTAGLDQAALRNQTRPERRFVLRYGSRARAEEYIERLRGDAEYDITVVGGPEIDTVDGYRVVTVRLETTVRRIFARSIPGSSDHTITAEASATLEELP